MHTLWNGNLAFCHFLSYSDICFTLRLALLTVQTNVCEMSGKHWCFAPKQVVWYKIFIGIL